jgi:hypothetical protein
MARRTAKRIGESDQVRAATNAARQVSEHERVQAAGAQVANTAQRAARSDQVQAVTGKAAETARQVRHSSRWRGPGTPPPTRRGALRMPSRPTR